MVAIILAAGQGTRLGNRSNGLPKCLLRFGGLSLIEHQVAGLHACGIRQIFAVVGYQAAEIQYRLGRSVHYVNNTRYASTNSLYSLWLARRHLQAGFLLLNGDVLFHPEILQRLMGSPYADVLAVQRKSEFEEEEMKVQLAGDRILAISKQLPPDQADGESLGIAKFSRQGAQVLARALHHLVRNGGAKEWAPRAFGAILSQHPIFCCDVEKLPWSEIDFPHDLDTAREYIWPQICAMRKLYAAA